MWVMWNLTCFLSEIVLVSVQDRCTVCAKHTIGLDVVFNAPMVLLGHEVQVGAHFSPFGESAILTQDRCTVCVEHTIGSEIILDAPDGTLGDVSHVEPHLFPYGDSVSVGVR